METLAKQPKTDADAGPNQEKQSFQSGGRGRETTSSGFRRRRRRTVPLSDR